MPFDKEISFYKRCQNYDGPTPQADYYQDVAVPYPLRYLLPGHVYTFQYLNDVDEAMIISIPDYLQPKKDKKAIMAAGLMEPSYLIERPYFDLRPIALSLPNLGADNQSEYVLNLKMMPTRDRLMVLELMYRVVVPLLLRAGIVDHGEHEGDLIPFLDRLQKAEYTRPFLGFKMDNLTGALGNSLYFWVNKYDKNRIRDVKVIDFDQLPRFGQADYANDAYTRFNGATLPDVQALYTSYVKNT